ELVEHLAFRGVLRCGEATAHYTGGESQGRRLLGGRREVIAGGPARIGRWRLGRPHYQVDFHILFDGFDILERHLERVDAQERALFLTQLSLAVKLIEHDPAYPATDAWRQLLASSAPRFVDAVEY